MEGQAGRWLWSGLAIAAIWAATAAAAIWAPGLISGSAHEHIPIVAINVPVWALLATGFVVMAPATTASDRRRLWAVYAAVVSVIWAAACAIAIVGPPIITGSDPTMIPIAGIVAPILAMAATAYASIGVVAVAAREETVGDRVDTLIRQLAGAVPEAG
jgi:hypothetical protein